MPNSYLFPWGLSSYFYLEDDALVALKKMAAAGVEWVELWANLHQFDPRFSPPNPGAVKQLMDELHLKPCSLHSPFSGFDAGLSEAEQEQVWLTQTKKAIEYASAAGVDIVTVHPIFFYQHPGEDEIHVIHCKEKLLKEVVRHARTQKVRIALENMRKQRTSLYTHTAQLKRLIERIGDETVGICLDTGHALNNGADLSEEINAAGELLITLHVNDNYLGDQDAHLVPGEGVIDWQPFVKDLQAIHYSGIFLLEIRSGPDQEELLNKMRAFVNSQLYTAT